MEVDIRHRPAFAALFVTLAPGESIIAEADAMASMSANVRMRTRFNGGFFAALLRRIFGGESLFINEFYVPHGVSENGTLVCTQPTPGDMTRVDLNGQTLYLQPGAFIACAPGVQLGLGWAGFASWFGGEGLFRLSVSGHGAVWIGAYGGIWERQVNGQLMVDTGHLVAYEPTLSLNIALSGGIFSSFFGGEGFVSRVSGQGVVYLQSRSIETLADWTNRHLY